MLISRSTKYYEKRAWERVIYTKEIIVKKVTQKHNTLLVTISFPYCIKYYSAILNMNNNEFMPNIFKCN